MSRRRTTLRALIAVVVSALGIFASSPALAHTEFDFSLPAAGESVEAPVNEITVAFTLPVTLVGDGFEVLTPAGEIVQPAVSSDDDREFTLTLDPPLAGGDVGVRYEVRAEDGHVLADGFAFTVGEVPAEPTTTPPTTAPPATTPTTAPPVTAPPTTSASAPTSPSTTASASTLAPAATDDATSEEATVSTTEVTTSDSTDDGGSNIAIWVAIGAVLVVGAGSFLFVRARRTP